MHFNPIFTDFSCPPILETRENLEVFPSGGMRLDRYRAFGLGFLNKGVRWNRFTGLEGGIERARAASASSDGAARGTDTAPCAHGRRQPAGHRRSSQVRVVGSFLYKRKGELRGFKRTRFLFPG